MNTNYIDKQILSNFPLVELSYDPIVHKKVHNAHIISAIPHGIRAFAWFTTFKGQYVCFILELNEHNKISKVHRNYYVSFNHELCYQTILYGTFFKHKTQSYFSLQDIFYYKGNNIAKKRFTYKLDLAAHIFQYDINQISYFSNNVIFGLPLMSSSYFDLLKLIKELPYKIKYVQFRYLNRKQGHDVVNMTYVVNNNYYNKEKQTITELIFNIKPDIQNDIYHLHYYHNGSKENYFDIANIPDYKTSVMMNKLFRNIKENRNLDTLEESDDEEEFENNAEDKYVYLDKSCTMTCQYNYKHKRWTPIELAPRSARIVCKKDLPILEK